MKLKIISDGTNAGTHLIDEDTGEIINKISKITWEIDAKEDWISKTTVELTNVPVEIVSKAEVDLYKYHDPNYDSLLKTKTFEKEIKIVSEVSDPSLIIRTKVYDNQTNEVIGAIQKIKWEATPLERAAKLDKIKFEKKDW
jgi:hypothetical protein